MKILFIAMCMILTSQVMAASNFDRTEKKLKKAITADIRSDSEKARDKNRMPIETLAFLGMRDDMKVVELIPGGGWYTKLLAPVLAENGELIVALGTGRIEPTLLKESGFEKVKVSAKESEFFKGEGDRFYTLKVKNFNVTSADMVLTFRNYHNFNEASRRAMNKLAYDGLKKGGIYAVVDHTRRHMEPETPENVRRIDPILTIKEVQEAGFELVDYSDLHYRADDELRYEVGRKSVTGNTDRFTLKFRKK